MFISDIVDLTFVKFSKTPDRALNFWQTYRTPILRVAGSGLMAAVGYASYLFFKPGLQSRFTFSGDLGKFFKNITSILVKLTYSTVVILTEVQSAVLWATIGKKIENLVEFFKSTMDKIKEN